MPRPHLFAALILCLTLGLNPGVARANDVKIGLFSTPNLQECFLTETELTKLVAILRRMRAIPGATVPPGKPPELVFCCWEYARAERTFKRHNIAFNSDGSSAVWKISPRDAKSIVALAQKLQRRVR